MTDALTIAIDAMSGDEGPGVVVEGAEMSRVRHPEAKFVFVGDQSRIEPLLAAHIDLQSVSQVEHAPNIVAMDEKPARALKNRRGTSMWESINCVREGRAQAIVSAGNTGALMAMARYQLKTIPGVDRPAIAGIWPTIRGESIVLDVGANVGSTDRQLVTFAIMGEACARFLFGLERPSVGLLNIGIEDLKGTENVKGAAQTLVEADLPIRFHGFVEGNDIGAGTVDVVVTDGFTGNVALKTAEGTARQISHYLESAIRRSFLARIGYLLAHGAFRTLRSKMDPRHMNGGVFLGLNELVIKSHGGTDALGFASALDVAIDMATAKLPRKIEEDIRHIYGDDISVIDEIANGLDGQEQEAAVS